MTNIFLHEAAHILGGRHENAATIEHFDLSVELGSPNPLSILDPFPSLKAVAQMQLHPKDIQRFHEFMTFPEGHNLSGFPIHDVIPPTQAQTTP